MQSRIDKAKLLSLYARLCVCAFCFVLVFQTRPFMVFGINYNIDYLISPPPSPPITVVAGKKQTGDKVTVTPGGLNSSPPHPLPIYPRPSTPVPALSPNPYPFFDVPRNFLGFISADEVKYHLTMGMVSARRCLFVCLLASPTAAARAAPAALLVCFVLFLSSFFTDKRDPTVLK